MKKKIAFGSILFLFIISTIYGVYLFNKPVEGVASMKTDYSITAPLLLSEFEENEVVANTKYLDKVLEVTGTILSLEREDGKTSMYLKSGSPLSTITCEMKEIKNERDFNIGHEVTVKGICTGFLMDVILVRCIVLNDN